MEVKNPIKPSVLELSSKFDVAYKAHDIDEIKKLLDHSLDLRERVNDVSKIQLFYSIGTAYGDLFELDDSLIFNVDLDYTIKQIYYFRQAITISETLKVSHEEKRFIDPLLCSLYTNYANILDGCGRKQLAIEMYNKAIKINQNFTMATGNLAISLDHYRRFIDIDEHFHFVKEIKHLLSLSLDTTDLNQVDYAKSRFQELEERYLEFDVSEECTCRDTVYNLETERYRHWCWENILYLNSLNDLQADDINRFYDNIQLIELSSSNANELKRLLSMFNQIKQEYVYSRYLCYESLNVGEVHYADENVSLVDCYDYTQYSVRVEGLKTAFKSLYSLLDKVAMFINEYYKLEIRVRKINFHSIWKCDKLKGMLDKNIGLSAIYWISQDFENAEQTLTANPKSKRLQVTRNCLEHRFTNVVLDFVGSSDDSDESQLYITEYELRSYTIDLLHLVRELILSLKNAILISEVHKKQNLDDEILSLSMLFGEFKQEDKM